MNKIKSNFFYQTLYQILSMILPLITSPILSRALGANGLGVYSYTTTILNYFVLIANLGIYRYGIRCIASAGDDKIERSKVFWEIFLSHILISVVIFGLYILFVVNFQGEYLQYYIVLTLMYLGGTLNINWFFFGIEEYKGVAIRDMVIKIATFVLIVLCVNNEHDLYTYFIIMAASSFISNATYYVMIRGKISRPQVCWCNMWTHLKHMLILFVPTLLETMYISIDKVILGSVSDKANVGYYENADKALISKTLIYSLTNVMFPRMTYLLANKEVKGFEKLMNKSIKFVVFASIAFSFGTAAIAKEFSVVFWGEAFLPCAALITILAFTIPANTLSRAIRDQYLIPAGRDKDYIVVMAWGAFCDIILDFVLIPFCGAAGAAIATLFTEYLMLFIQIKFVKRQIDFMKYLNRRNIRVYIFIGLIMLFTCKSIGRLLGMHPYTLVAQIFIGMMVFMLPCVVYWNKTNDDTMLSILKTFGGKNEYK